MLLGKYQGEGKSLLLLSALCYLNGQITWPRGNRKGGEFCEHPTGNAYKPEQHLCVSSAQYVMYLRRRRGAGASAAVGLTTCTSSGQNIEQPITPCPPQLSHMKICRILPSSASTVKPKGSHTNWVQPHSAFSCTLRNNTGSIRLKETRYISHLLFLCPAVHLHFIYCIIITSHTAKKFLAFHTKPKQTLTQLHNCSFL